MEVFAIIMAGGIGSRFWPRSKQKAPKQLMKIFGDKTMIQDTVARLDGIVENKNIFVITNEIQKPQVVEQLPQLPEENIIDEPFGKNTAACVGLSAAIVKKKNSKAVMITLPADHFIKDVKEFQENITVAIKFAEKSKGLVTIGINPNKPETGYGYIQIDDKKSDENIHKVLTFAEKPNLGTAKRFMKAGDFLWNSGMFIWSVEAIWEEIKTHMPDLYSGINEIYDAYETDDFKKVLREVYGQIKSISIDYGVMEKSKNVYLTKGYFDWSDVGSWEAVYELSEKDKDDNAKIGEVYSSDTFSSYIYSPNKFTAVIGGHNLIVIDTDEALLICDRNNAQDVKNIVDYLKMNNHKELI
ncbi:MAG: NTP transferase domain-containing protein [Ignavibacteriae bacterium]|jgi:mannose-1-phosphate guanylyltransferase|nr:mannose-1-phosphate guanylyltransferase [Ignavibacteriota bacterium]NOG98197.1 NTP transferase domain-containing protein [Ignavibacteriota bacterium]